MNDPIIFGKVPFLLAALFQLEDLTIGLIMGMVLFLILVTPPCVNPGVLP